MKIGRNEPCPCGSGKKYKHCCGGLQAEPPMPEDPRWIRLNRATHGLTEELLKFARRHFGPEGVEEAWQEFNGWEDEEEFFDPSSPHVPVFVPWFFYHWTPDEEDTAVPGAAHGTTVAQAYIIAKGRRLDPLLQRYLEACGQAAFSFHEVVRRSGQRRAPSRCAYPARIRRHRASGFAAVQRRGHWNATALRPSRAAGED